MGALVLACGNATTTASPGPLTDSARAELRELPARPGRKVLDPVLSEFTGDRLVVRGDDADLAAVVLRLMVKDRLAVTVGYLPTEPRVSRVARLWGLPLDRPDRLAEVAAGGSGRAVPLVRDDAGGVLLGHGVVHRPRGLAFCDDATALHGAAGRIEVAPDTAGGAGLVARVVWGLFGRKSREFRGRAFQLGCSATTVERDGVAVEGATKWTWYRHTEDLRLALP
ncbi:hypothetical protein [Actinokineospora pegani]|uniref:hypothetical protein n=1 Tax=Actinokineospora pegani TaxID=2654637 RepID=UPI0012EA7114|nr:hypothetical protein [Actinokineospora pegani]